MPVLKVPAGTRIYVGRPAKPKEAAVVQAISDLIARAPGITEAHLPQMYAAGAIEPSAQVLVVVIDSAVQAEAALAAILDGLGGILPDGTHLDVLPLTHQNPLLSAVRGAGCSLKVSGFHP